MKSIVHALAALAALSFACTVEPQSPSLLLSGKGENGGRPDQAFDALPHLQALTSGWVHQVLTEHDVVDLYARAIFAADEVFAQTSLFVNEVSFVDALRAAINSYIVDGTDEESPRYLIKEFGGPCPPADLSEQVRCAMRYYGSRLLLVHRASEYGGVADSHRIAWFPEGSEADEIEQSWMFELMLPQLGDHSHWAIVSRTRDPQGNILVSNYGFN